MSDEIMKPSEITEHFTIPNVRGTSTTNRAGYEAHLQALAQRQSVGRYTLEEAAIAIKEATGARDDEMLHKFRKAAGAGALPTYEPGKNSQYIYGEDFASRVRESYEEAYWDDLNTWLEAKEKRITWRFPAPVSQKVSAGDTATTETKNWMLRIQTEAARRWKALRAGDANPTKHNIRVDLAKWCKEIGVMTDRDINPSADYIYRHVLRKWTPPKD